MARTTKSPPVSRATQASLWYKTRLNLMCTTLLEILMPILIKTVPNRLERWPKASPPANRIFRKCCRRQQTRQAKKTISLPAQMSARNILFKLKVNSSCQVRRIANRRWYSQREDRMYTIKKCSSTTRTPRSTKTITHWSRRASLSKTSLATKFKSLSPTRGLPRLSSRTSRSS